MMHWDDWPMGGMWLWWLLLVAAAIVGIWSVARISRSASGPSEDSPEEVLKRRYARGDIDKVTYEDMLAELRK